MHVELYCGRIRDSRELVWLLCCTSTVATVNSYASFVKALAVLHGQQSVMQLGYWYICILKTALPTV